MSYDVPAARETYVFPSSAFGATTENRKFIGPKGKKGTVRDIRTYITADMVGTTTVPEINVGSAASDAGAVVAEYARHRLGTTAILGNTGTATPTTYRASALALGAPGYTGGSPPSLTDFAGHVLLEIAKIPKDTAFFICRIKGAGGTP